MPDVDGESLMQLQSVGDDARSVHEIAQALATEVGRVVRGKDDAIRLAIVSVLAGSHLLIEDTPGTGKTLLAKSLAAALGGTFRRVQCTPDLLPSDLTGTTVYSPLTGVWQFRPGPVFANVLLADELNRASPRTQAALLEPLEELHATVDGEQHPLPSPFICIATQNPYGSAGTFPLPDSQLDRFGMVIRMGLPSRAAERDILRGTGGTDAFERVVATTTPREMMHAIVQVRSVHVAEGITEYVLDLAAATRSHAQLGLGASPRATKSLLRAAQAHAVVQGRGYVSPDDVQAIAAASLSHRLSLSGNASIDHGAQVVAEALASTPVPRP